MEAEILMPPCTALQLVETSVDKDTLVVSFRPTITRPEVRSGTDDITRWHLARAGVERRRAAEVAAASAALEEEKRRRGAEEAAYEWRLAMSATRLRGSQMHAAQLVTNLCESKRREIAERMKHSTTQSRMLLRDTAATLDAQVAAAEQAEAARKASAGASVDVEQVASKQLQWALLSMNPRLARTVQQEIVQQDRQGAAAAGAAGEQQPPVQLAGSLLESLESIVTKLTGPRARKGLSDADVGAMFAEAVDCMDRAPASLQVQMLGCCALACLCSELSAAEEAAAKSSLVKPGLVKPGLVKPGQQAVAEEATALVAPPPPPEQQEEAAQLEEAAGEPKGEEVHEQQPARLMKRSATTRMPPPSAVRRSNTSLNTSVDTSTTRLEAGGEKTTSSSVRDKGLARDEAGGSLAPSTASAAAAAAAATAAAPAPVPAEASAEEAAAVETLARAELLRRAAVDSKCLQAIQRALEVLPRAHTCIHTHVHTHTHIHRYIDTLIRVLPKSAYTRTRNT